MCCTEVKTREGAEKVFSQDIFGVGFCCCFYFELLSFSVFQYVNQHKFSSILQVKNAFSRTTF